MILGLSLWKCGESVAPLLPQVLDLSGDRRLAHNLRQLGEDDRRTGWQGRDQAGELEVGQGRPSTSHNCHG